MEYTITPQYHEKKACYIFVVRLSERLSKGAFTNLSELAKSHNGYYSSFRGVNGFVFKSEEEAENFAEDTMIIIDALQTSSIAKQSNAIPACEEKNTLNPPATGMELHKALRAVIQSEGDTIITETRLVNILDDFKAYTDMPPAKYILRAIIADGYAHKLLSIGKWNNDAMNLASRFASTTGFMPDAVEILFKSMAYGLEYLDSNPFSCKNDTNVNKNSKAAVTKTRKKKEQHLKFKGIDITGEPVAFSEALEQCGFVEGSWWDDFFTMKGPFAGVPNCELFVHFDSQENMVYNVRVHFPSYQNCERVKRDYKKLKKSLKDLYGKPTSVNEFWDSNWDTIYSISTGIIKLVYSVNHVQIEYYDGYYESHHGEIKDDIVKLDL